MLVIEVVRIEVQKLNAQIKPTDKASNLASNAQLQWIATIKHSSDTKSWGRFRETDLKKT